jgi:hypothetical protein
MAGGGDYSNGCHPHPMTICMSISHIPLILLIINIRRSIKHDTAIETPPPYLSANMMYDKYTFPMCS